MAKDEKPQATQSPFNDWTNALQDAGFKSMGGAGMDWLETLSGMGSEMVRFTADRFKVDMQARDEIVSAKGLAEVQHIQTLFFQKAIEDYTAQSTKLMEMMKSLTPNPSDGAKSTG